MPPRKTTAKKTAAKRATPKKAAAKKQPAKRTTAQGTPTTTRKREPKVEQARRQDADVEWDGGNPYAPK